MNGKVKNYLSANNGKLRKAGIFAFGIPAGLTCPAKGECAKGCYAMAGFFLMPSVRQAQADRLALTKSENFVEVITAEIVRRKVKTLRIHDSGDFYSAEYLAKWFEIMEKCRSTHFYAYTKRVDLLKDKPKPGNFTVILSFGGVHDDKINVNRDRHSAVFSSQEELFAAGYVDASHDDTQAYGASHKIGLIYHGAKSRAWNTESMVSV